VGKPARAIGPSVSDNKTPLLLFAQWGKRHGPRSFRVAAPTVSNDLPIHLRTDDSWFANYEDDLICTGLFVRAAA